MGNFVDSSTIFCCNFTELKDLSYNNKPITNTNTTIDTVNGKFGSGLNCTSTSDKRLVIPHTFNYTDNWTFECFLKPNKTKSWACLLSTENFTNGANDLTIYLSGNKLILYPSVNGEGTVLPTNTWTHIAVTKEGDTFRLFVGGVKVLEKVNTGKGLKGNYLSLFSKYTSTTENFEGWVDEVRISNVCRYKADYTPPTTEYMRTFIDVLNSTEQVCSITQSVDIDSLSVYVNNILDKTYTTNLKADGVTVHTYNSSLISTTTDNTIKLVGVKNGTSCELAFPYTYLPVLSMSATLTTTINRLQDFVNRQQKENGIFRGILKDKGITGDLNSYRYEELIEFVRLLPSLPKTITITSIANADFVEGCNLKFTPYDVLKDNDIIRIIIDGVDTVGYYYKISEPGNLYMASGFGGTLNNFRGKKTQIQFPSGEKSGEFVLV